MTVHTKILCPRCEAGHYTPYGEETKHLPVEAIQGTPFPALSRMDNKTYICSDCGTEEAMRDFNGEPPIPPEDWPIEAEEQRL